MFLPWLLLACSLPTPSQPSPESPAARAAEEIANVAKATEELSEEAEKIALLTERLLQEESISDTARQTLSDQVERARIKSKAAQSALDRATDILATANN